MRPLGSVSTQYETQKGGILRELKGQGLLAGGTGSPSTWPSSYSTMGLQKAGSREDPPRQEKGREKENGGGMRTSSGVHMAFDFGLV